MYIIFVQLIFSPFFLFFPFFSCDWFQVNMILLVRWYDNDDTLDATVTYDFIRNRNSVEYVPHAAYTVHTIHAIIISPTSERRVCVCALFGWLDYVFAIHK